METANCHPQRSAGLNEWHCAVPKIRESFFDRLQERFPKNRADMKHQVMIEKYPLSRVAEAYEQMNSGKVRFCAMLTMVE